MIDHVREFKTAEECLKDVNGIIARYRNSHTVDTLTIEVNAESARYWLSLREKDREAA